MATGIVWIIVLGSTLKVTELADQRVSPSTFTSSAALMETEPSTSIKTEHGTTARLMNKELEEQYWTHFKENIPEEEINLTHWNTVWLSFQLQKTAAGRICEEAYIILKLYYSSSENITPPKMQSYEYCNTNIIIRSLNTDEETKFDITVLQCETYDEQKFYLTNGRRPNSVYFVRPTVAYNEYGLPDNFVLDPNFQSDFDLPYNFLKFTLQRKNIRPNNSNSTPQDRVLLEKQYVDHFYGKFVRPAVKLTEWTTLKILDRHEKVVVERMCKEAYVAQHPSCAKLGISPAVHSYDYNNCELNILSWLPQRPLHFSITVLRCNVEEQIFYITKGRRPNSVYFVKPTAPQGKYHKFPTHFVLDVNFEGDVDLPFDFYQLALLLNQALYPHHQFV